MALQMTYNLGADFPITAYLRIKNLNITYDPIAADKLSPGLKFIMTPLLEVKSGRLKNVLETWCNISWISAYDHTTNTNAIKQAYIYLKTLPEFTGAIDANE